MNTFLSIGYLSNGLLLLLAVVTTPGYSAQKRMELMISLIILSVFPFGILITVFLLLVADKLKLLEDWR
jgi:hypothetical protein